MDEAALWDLLNSSRESMTFAQRRFWDVIRIQPEKWKQRGYGMSNGGFWAVAIIGPTVVWYNHLEYGFNRSRFARWGEIIEFGSNQFALEEAIQHVLNELEVGYATAPISSPPVPGKCPGDQR